MKKFYLIVSRVLVVLMTFSLIPLLANAKSRGSMLPYAYKDGQTYLLVAFDSKAKLYWDVFGCDLTEGEDVFGQIAFYTHCGTRGVFAGVSDELLLKNWRQQKALQKGIRFFEDRFESSNLYLVEKVDEKNFMFFVEVPFMSAKTLVEPVDAFSSNHEGFTGDEFFEYQRKIGFAWISVANLLLKIAKWENSSKKDDKCSIILTGIADEHQTFMAKPKKLADRYKGKKIMLNPNLSENLMSSGVLEILQKITVKNR